MKIMYSVKFLLCRVFNINENIGLFHRGISQSGSSLCYWSILENSTATARRVGNLLNCTGSSHQMVECLRSVDAQAIAPIQLQLVVIFKNFNFPTVTHIFIFSCHLAWCYLKIILIAPGLEPISHCRFWTGGGASTSWSVHD